MSKIHHTPDMRELRQRLEAVKAINRNGATWRNGKDIEFLLVHKGHPYRHWEIEHAEWIRLSPLDVAVRDENMLKNVGKGFLPNPDYDLVYQSSEVLTAHSYGNAQKTARKLNAKYCEGFLHITGTLFVDHAWNSLEGLYFDVTQQLADHRLLGVTGGYLLKTLEIDLGVMEALIKVREAEPNQEGKSRQLTPYYLREYVQEFKGKKILCAGPWVR